MSETDPRARTPLNWSDLGVSELPTGTVTLLLADVEGSTELWQTASREMMAAVARLDRTVCELTSAHHGVRPIEQGEGDSFVVAFARASDAVACALQLQLAPLAPIRLRIGVHTGEVQLRDDANYVGTTINRTARLRDLAHGGQTVLSGTTEDLVADLLPADAWTAELGSYRLRDLPRLERVVQLCHSDIRNEFPPLRARESVALQNLPPQFTSFVGREAQMRHVREIILGNRFVTLTGAGGVGKTRLAIEVAADAAGTFDGGVRYVDLAPITDPDLVPVTATRAFGLPDQPGRSTMEVLRRAVGDERILLVLDNCEHLLDASAALVTGLQAACPAVTVMATSREPVGLPGEVIVRVPSLTLADEAVKLFVDRARHVSSGFRVTDENSTVVAEICRRLDGVPLAIELAAARVRVLSPTEIRDGLHDRFRLLTGGARTAVRRQQTLQASVDWSHALLTGPERTSFARLAVFVGGFDLRAAEAVVSGEGVERFQVLDLLTLLVDKSLVTAETAEGATRYRLLETVRQYALGKLGDSGEGDSVRARHRDYYTQMASLLDTSADDGIQQRLEQADAEIDNLRAAFAWSCENFDTGLAFQLASSLQPMWLARGRIREGLSWFEALAEPEDELSSLSPAVRAYSLADRATLSAYLGADADCMGQARQALTIARQFDDPALLLRALIACGGAAVYDADLARPYFAEAVGLARSLNDRWRLSSILSWQAYGSVMEGDPAEIRKIAEEGRDLSDSVGHRSASHGCRWSLGVARVMTGDAVGAATQLREVVAMADEAHDPIWKSSALFMLALSLAYHGDPDAARRAADASVEVASELGGFYPGLAYAGLTIAALAGGDVAAAEDAIAAGRPHLSLQPKQAAIWVAYAAQAALARGELTTARQLAEDAVGSTTGLHLALALTTRAGVQIAQGEPEHAGRDAHEALLVAARTGAHGVTADTFECLALLAFGAGNHPEAARLYGAAHSLRRRGGLVRFRIFDDIHESAGAALREALGSDDFASVWAEGSGLSTDEAIAYAQRRRGRRKRPTTGWDSLTPTERDVVRLVSQGMANNEIAARLFISPRTVQTHLTHIYSKLGLPSRVHLAQEAARHV